MAGIDPATGEIADGIEAQTEQALRNLAAVLDAAGCSMDDIVKTTIFYANVEDFARLNEVYSRHMSDPPRRVRLRPTSVCHAAARLDRGDRSRYAALRVVGVASVTERASGVLHLGMSLP